MILIDLRSVRIQRVADQLAPALEHEAVLIDADQLSNVDEWRAAVRKAGRDRGWRVRTGLCRDGARAWATRTDRRATPVDSEAVAGLMARARPALALIDPK